jgi:hypothetical protein
MKTTALFIALLLLTGCQGYKVENGSWSLIRYNEGVGRMVTKIEGANQNSFQPIDKEYAKDNEHVYQDADLIKGADPSAFVVLGSHYSKDGTRVFWYEREIVGADPASFKIVDGANLWSKDKNDYYFADHALHVVDVGSFKIINGGWAKDSQAYYATPQFSAKGKVDCDYASMRILSELYAVDKKRAYYGLTPIPGVDVKTFRVTGTITARDAYKKYRGEREDWLK